MTHGDVVKMKLCAFTTAFHTRSNKPVQPRDRQTHARTHTHRKRKRRESQTERETETEIRQRK